MTRYHSRLDLSEFGIPQPGWPGRGWAIAKLAAYVVGMLLFLLFLLGVTMAVILVLGAKAGAL